MNRQQRKELAIMLDGISQITYALGNISASLADPETQLDDVLAELGRTADGAEDICAAVELVRDAEQDKYDNMHNSLYYVQSYDWEHVRRKRILISAINEELARALVIVDCLDEAIDDINKASHNLSTQSREPARLVALIEAAANRLQEATEKIDEAVSA
jgi:hypothetical protein